MNRVFFHVRRVWRRLWEIASVAYYELDFWVTPAELDLLRVVHTYVHGVPRFKLVRILGVSGPVVSRMVRKLEDEGLVKRVRDARDGRAVIVHLPEIVRATMDEVTAEVERLGAAKVRELFVSTELGGIELQMLEWFLLRARHRSDDRAAFADPFTPREILVTRSSWMDLTWARVEEPPPTFAEAA